MTVVKKWKVLVIESERGWGQKVDSVHVFDTYEEALKFQTKFNEPNTAISAPDWYMVAEAPFQAY